MNKRWLLILLLCLGVQLRGFTQTLSYTDSLIQVVETTPNLSDSAIYVLYCDIAWSSPNAYVVIEYSKKAIAFAKDRQLDVNLAQAVTTLGIGLLRKKDLVAATEAFLQGAVLYQQSGNKVGMATVYEYLGQVFRAQDQPQKARQYYQSAIHIYTAAQDSARLANVLHNMGYLYVKLNQPDSALPYLEAALDIFRANNDKLLIAYGTGSLGLVYAQKDQPDKAEAYLQRAILQLEALQDNYAIAEYSLEIAAIYEARGRVSQALFHALKSYQLAKAMGAKEYVRDATLKLSELYARQQDYQQAYAFQKAYIAYRDSINNEETINEIADLHREYQVAQKQQEIDHLQQAKSNQQLLLLGMGIIVLLAAILIYVLYKYNRQKQASNKQLYSQNIELVRQRHELEVLNATRNKFFSIISHDLRGPVNAFSGISRLIWQYIQAKDYQQLADLAAYIDRSASQLSALLDNLLSWSVLQQGQFPHNPEKLCVKALLEDTVAELQSMVIAKNIEVQLFAEEAGYVWADLNAVRTILRNLTANALKFTHAGGEVTLAALQAEGMAAISVADNGIGMPEEKLQALNNRQTEARTWGTAGEKGLGIGLGLVFELVQLNGGQLSVSSEEGKGTIFSVQLPSTSPPEVALSSTKPASARQDTGQMH